MKKKAFLFKGSLLLALFFIILTFSACNITSENFWSSDSNVIGRFDGLKNLGHIDIINDDKKDDDKAFVSESECSQYQVLMLTDVHIGAKYYKEEFAEKFYKWLDSYDFKENKVLFACGLGDFADSATEEQMKGYKEITDRIEAKGIKVFNVIGNHDLFKPDGYQIFQDYCFPNTSFYRFETKKIAWYGLDSGSGMLGSKQLNSFQRMLDREEKYPVVLTHIPLISNHMEDWLLYYSMRDTTERNILISLLDEKKSPAYFCGHQHGGDISHFGQYLVQYNLRSFGQYGAWYIIDVDESGEIPVFSLTNFGE